MVGKLSRRAHNVILLAQEEARFFGHTHLGTAHLLLGLSGEDASVAAAVLRRLGVEADEARGQVESIEGWGLGDAGDSVPFTPRMKRVLEGSSRASQSQGHRYVGTDHLLVGLLDEREGISARVLLNLGIDPDEALQNAVEILRARGADEDDPLERVP
jgi:ATP-dependent Clp protease ATP-binding subunit ClpC